MAAPRVTVLRAPGTNCDEETAYAFESAGAAPQRVHVQRLLESPRPLEQSQILCIPGGFSYGDDIAAGRILADQLQWGLADAVRQVAGASGVGATIDADALPLDRDARSWFDQRGLDAVAEAITGGDDYELLVTSRPRTRGRLAAASRHGDAPLTRIGSCTADRALILRQHGSERPLPRGYSHFR